MANSSNKTKKTTTNSNLTARQIIAWKDNVTNAVSQHLVSSLQEATEYATTLSKITAADEAETMNLSYRFNDLSILTSQAAAQLNTFMKTFDSKLTSYINKLKKEEEEKAESMRKNLDNFKESAKTISELKI